MPVCLLRQGSMAFFGREHYPEGVSKRAFRLHRIRHGVRREEKCGLKGNLSGRHSRMKREHGETVHTQLPG